MMYYYHSITMIIYNHFNGLLLFIDKWQIDHGLIHGR
nr:MAG TPA: hypothetical protein [Caudoviricetes sp.]